MSPSSVFGMTASTEISVFNMSKGNQCLFNVFIVFICNVTVLTPKAFVYPSKTLKFQKLYSKEETRNSDTCDPQCHSKGVSVRMIYIAMLISVIKQ